MAFNPFEAFSIRSKLGRSVMAVLGIVVMLTFVLSTGAVGTRNDFFDQIGHMFSSKGRGQVLATGYGDDIHDTDLGEISRQRRAANMYLLAAIESAYGEWARELQRDLDANRFTPETKNALAQFVGLRANPNADPRAYQAFLNNPQSMQRILIAQIMAKPESEDKKALEAATAIIGHDMFRGGPQAPPVLPDLGEERGRDMVAFALVLKKADKLGIRYSADAVRELVQRETGGRLARDENARIERDLRQGRQGEGMTGDWLLEAIGNEYRARAALTALQGQSAIAMAVREQRNFYLTQLFRFPAPGRPLGDTEIASAPPGGLTPYEFYEFYKDRCSEHNYSLIEVRAENFLDQVTGEPTPRERAELFNKYRGELPDPAKPTPGFKEPRKVKVEYVALDAKADRVTKAIPAVRAASLFLSATGGALSGDRTTAAVQTAHPADTHPAIGTELVIRQAVREKQSEALTPFQNIYWWEFEPRDTSIYRPQPIVSALGVLAGGPDVATFTAAVAAVRQQVQVIELRARIPFLLQPVFTPFNPTMGNALGMPAFAYALAPKAPPDGLYLATATEAHRKEQRRMLFQADVDQLETKLRELGRDANPFLPKLDKEQAPKAREAAKKHLTDWLKERGLTPAGNKESRDQYALVTDSDLKPLNDKAPPDPDGTNSLGKQLYESDERMGGRSGNPRYFIQPFQPFWFPANPVGDDLDKPSFFAWLTDETAATTYVSLATADKLTSGEMTKRVDRAWKMEKARDKARAEIERLAEQVKVIGKSAATDPGGVDKQLRDLAEQQKARKFEIERLALLQFQHGATQAQQGYQRAKIDKSQVLYPTDGFADRLLELRKEPVGAVTILSDAPRTRFYVACETGRTEKTVDQFRDVFTKATAVGPANNPLYNQYALPEERGQAVTEVLARLRAEAGLEEKDALKNREKREAE